MNRTSCLAAIAVLAMVVAGCGNDRAIKDDQVRAMNFKDGTVKTFSSEGEVPDGWGVCPDNDCETVPPGVPCQNLGEEVCELNASCRLRDSVCSSPGYNPDSGEAPPDSTEVTCDKVCVPKGDLQCDELDKQGCGTRPDCAWGEICASSSSSKAPCFEDDCASDPIPVTCTEVCHPKQPLGCDQLDEKTCDSRSDCSWTIMACPAIGCLEEDDPACECKPFCQPTPPTGCADNTGCEEGQYCAFEQGCAGYGVTDSSSGNAGSGSAGGSSDPEGAEPFKADPMPPVDGVCKVKPDACTLEYGPVCGCDNKEYSNKCMAASAGVNVMNHGPCEVPPPPPGSCVDDAECAEDHFCAFETGACGLAMPMTNGSCKLKPQACYQVYSPVCGCDGQTYSNDCDAHANGANIAHVGECNTPKPACIITGCSSQLCASQPMQSSCEWIPEYACLDHSTCGNFAADGGCGWEQNQDYLDCVALAKQ